MMRGLGKYVPFLVGALVLFVIYSAIRVGTSDFLCSRALARMEQSSFAASQDDGSVAGMLNAARLIAPENPDVYESMARLEAMRASSDNAEARDAALRRGLVLARHAILLRPVSPYSWNQLLWFKNALGEYDGEFRRSLDATLKLGPWEPVLQVDVAEIGMKSWPLLSGQERVMVEEDVMRGMKHQAKEMRSIVRQHWPDCTGDDLSGCMK